MIQLQYFAARRSNTGARFFVYSYPAAWYNIVSKRAEVVSTKTLIINGSPRRDGDTAALVAAFMAELKGEARVVTCQDDIAPCSDCRCCWERPGCAIHDGMQAVYDYIAECDNIVLASPIWYSSLSGPMLNIASRLQTLFIGRFRRGEDHTPNKNGVLILTGAQPHTKAAPEQSAMTIMRNMRVMSPLAATVYSLNTDNIPAAEDAAALLQARNAAHILNSRCDMEG